LFCGDEFLAAALVFERSSLTRRRMGGEKLHASARESGARRQE
jgi:hypothetical protein